MTEEQAIVLDALKQNISALKEQVIQLKTNNDELLNENNRLQNELSELQSEHAGINRNFEMLKLAKAFSGSEEEKTEMKKKLGLMMRDIDKCIELLKE